MTVRKGPAAPAVMPKTCQYTVTTSRGDYQVRISWPLSWGEDRKPPSHVTEIPTIYVVDGNAYFFTVTEINRRIGLISGAHAIIVGIGYPLTNNIFHRQRRSEDLTPPTEGGYDDVARSDEEPLRLGFRFGGASDFLDIIEHTIVPHVEDEVFPHLPLRTSRRALFGHSFGGLFTLNALFTRPSLFDTFAACSPSIWWHGCSIAKEQERAFWAAPTEGPRPRLLVTYGSLEQHPERRRGEPDEDFGKRRHQSLQKRMKDNADSMVARLKSCPRVRSVWSWEFEGEDHGGAAPCGFQRALQKFLVDADE